MLIYIQNKNGKPLMPTKRCGAVRRWLRDDKASVIQLCPFTIRLNWDAGIKTQEIIVGLDTGSVEIGCSGVSKNKVLFASEIKLRTNIHNRMQRRAMYRKSRRSRKIRYRQPRFDNRTRQKGWLPPSLKSKAESTIKIIKKLSKILPIDKVRIEICKFDTQKLQNPDIKSIEYQQGKTEGYDNVRAFVFVRDNYTCQICKKKNGILQTHHIIQKKDGGSDRPDNLATVHKICHEDFHNGKIIHKFKKPKIYRDATQVTILKNYIIKELKKSYDIEITFGYITKKNRLRLCLEKTHYNDAIAICNPDMIEKPDIIYQFRAVAKKRYRMSQGIRSEKFMPDKRVFGFDVNDKVSCIKNNKKQIGFITGKMSTGYFVLGDINGHTIEKCTSYKYLDLIEYKNTLLTNSSTP